MMISILMIFITLTTSAPAKGPIECNFADPQPQTVCSGASGQLLVFYLPNSDVRLGKGENRILRIPQNGNAILYDQYARESTLFANGTLILGVARREQSGEYTMEQYGAEGVLMRNVTIRLEIQAPVSMPDLSEKCLSAEERSVTCSSLGDEIHFKLTLNGYWMQPTEGHSWCRPATETSGPSHTQTMCLHGQLSGELVCSVWNNVSNHQTVLHLRGCRRTLIPLITSSSPSSELNIQSTSPTLDVRDIGSSVSSDLSVAVRVGSVAFITVVVFCLIIYSQHKLLPTTIIVENNEEDVTSSAVTMKPLTARHDSQQDAAVASLVTS